MPHPPISPDQKIQLDASLKLLGFTRGKIAEVVRTQYLPDRYSRSESARGTINHWARGTGNLPDDFAKAIEEITSQTIKLLIGFDTVVYPDEITHDVNLFEGAKKEVSVNAYERNYSARIKCIEHYGYDCSVCGFNFKSIYGDIGANFIHVHHIKDIALMGGSYSVNPIEDLRPVCPNCHAMLHKEKPAISIEKLKAKVKG